MWFMKILLLFFIFTSVASSMKLQIDIESHDIAINEDGTEEEEEENEELAA